jgi:tRNA G46 methylase TrmB
MKHHRMVDSTMWTNFVSSLPEVGGALEFATDETKAFDDALEV